MGEGRGEEMRGRAYDSVGITVLELEQRLERALHLACDLRHGANGGGGEGEGGGSRRR